MLNYSTRERVDPPDLFSANSLFQSFNSSSHSGDSMISSLVDAKPGELKGGPRLVFLLRCFKGERMKNPLRLGGGERVGEISNMFSSEEALGQ